MQELRPGAPNPKLSAACTKYACGDTTEAHATLSRARSSKNAQKPPCGLAAATHSLASAASAPGPVGAAGA